MRNCVAVFRNYGSQCDRSYAVTASQFDRNETHGELVLRSNSLITRPRAIFNCDESEFIDETTCKLNIGISLKRKYRKTVLHYFFCFSAGMVIVSHKTKEAYKQCGSSGKSFTSGLIYGNAVGEVLLFFIIYATKALNPQ